MEEGWKEVLPKLESITIPVASYENHYTQKRTISIPGDAPPALPVINSGYQNHPNHAQSGYGSNPFLEEHNEDESVGV